MGLFGGVHFVPHRMVTGEKAQAKSRPRIQKKCHMPFDLVSVG